jgi:hypothetical protein
MKHSLLGIAKKKNEFFASSLMYIRPRSLIKR